MHPQLFHIGSFALPTYGFMAALGMISALSVIIHLARFRGLDPEQMWNLFGIGAFSGILGAKLLLLAIDWRVYVADPGRIFSVATLQSGGVFSGGLVLAIVCCWWYMRLHKIPFLSAADVSAPGIALGMPSGASAAWRRDAATDGRPRCPGGSRFTVPGRRSSPARR